MQVSGKKRFAGRRCPALVSYDLRVSTTSTASARMSAKPAATGLFALQAIKHKASTDGGEGSLGLEKLRF